MSITTSLSKSAVVIVNQEQLASEMGKEMIILDINSGNYFGLNSVGASIWNFIQQPQTVGNIIDFIVVEYSVDSSQCEEDIDNLLKELETESLIVIRDEVAV